MKLKKLIRRIAVMRVAVLVGIIVTASAIAGAVWVHYRVPPFINTWNLQQKENFWSARIAVLGSDKAYKEFVSDINSSDPQKRHLNAHIFGAVLYKAIGPASLGVCGPEFAFGCLHEVFKWIIAEHGVGGLSGAYNQYCDHGNGGMRTHQCEHAIGHGLLSFYGYNGASLLKALNICKSSFYEDPINGCVGGVFMEYNLYTSLGPTIQARSVTLSNWHEPCTDIPQEFRRACYMWLPQWWNVYFSQHKMPDDEIVMKMGGLCREDPNIYILDCFERVGQQIASTAKYNSDNTKTLCKKAAHTDGEYLSCVSYAAWVTTYVSTESLPNALAMCEGLSASDTAYCKAYATNEHSRNSPLPQPEE